MSGKNNEKATKSKLITHTGFRVYQIMEKVHHMDKKEVMYHLINHLLDTTMYAERLNYIQELFRNENDFQKPILDSYDNNVEDIIFSYFRRKMLQNSAEKYYTMCLAKGTELAFIVWRDNVWREATPLEKEETELVEWMDYTFQKEKAILKKVQDQYKGSNTFLESIVGFISVQKSMLEMDGYVFKVKNVLQVRNALGASCEQASREITIDRLNRVKEYLGKVDETYKIIGDNIYADIDNVATLRITKHHVCLIYEIFLRSIKVDGWFLSPEEAIYTDVSHLTIQSSIVGNKAVFDLQKKKQN